MNTTSTPTDLPEVQAEIERLRSTGVDTKTLYREAAAALFFRFGITPTANRLYQLVGKGSMTTASAVLAQFWKDLRDRTRISFEHPGVPDPLRSQAGELIGQIWSAAVQAARAEFEPLSREYQAAATQARQAADAAIAEKESLRTDLARADDLASDLRARLAEQEAELARRDSEIESAARGTSRLERELDAVKTELDIAKAAFRDDLENLRSAMEMAEERARSAERRAHADIEAERAKAAVQERATLAQVADLQEQLVARERSLVSQREEVAAVRAVVGRLEERLEAVSGQLAGERERFSQLLARVGGKAAGH